MKKRINVYITDDAERLARELSQKTGLSISAIATLAFTAGLKSIQMAVDPSWQAKFEQALKDDPEAFKKIIQGKERGMSDENAEESHVTIDILPTN